MIRNVGEIAVIVTVRTLVIGTLAWLGLVTAHHFDGRIPAIHYWATVTLVWMGVMFQTITAVGDALAED